MISDDRRWDIIDNIVKSEENDISRATAKFVSARDTSFTAFLHAFACLYDERKQGGSDEGGFVAMTDDEKGYVCRNSVCDREVYKDDFCDVHYHKDKHSRRCHEVFDDPMCWILAIVIDSNVVRFLEENPRSLGAQTVRKYGFTRNQQDWIEEITGKDVKEVMRGGGDEL